VSGKFYAKTLDLAKTYSKDGFKVTVGSKADKESDALQMVQKLNVATSQFPNNIPLQNINKKKTLDWLDLTPEEKAEVMNFDDQQPKGLPMPSEPSPNGSKLPLAPPSPIQGRIAQPALPQPVAA
jgi:hypothetical protein